MTEEITVKALPMSQPIGDFLIAVFPHEDLLRIATADIRAMAKDLDTYIGVQRKINPKRVKEIQEFAGTVDAAFPTSIVIAVESEHASYDSAKGELKLFADTQEGLKKIAHILDGQHRLEGLREYRGAAFDLSVTVVVDADMADQAYIFATVNLAQTKVNKSLVYDLLDYQDVRSPQKTCHEIAVSLDGYEQSPLHQMIKRLGHKTPGRENETLSQAVVVGSLIPFISRNDVQDRDLSARGKKIPPAENPAETPFRSLFVAKKDDVIAAILINYFRAVETKWPIAWRRREKGHMLPTTNGFKALMRLLKDIYLHLVGPDASGTEITEAQFLEIVQRARLEDDEFTTVKFVPGTQGENNLYKLLKEQCRV